jgi:hypothetical protein
MRRPMLAGLFSKNHARRQAGPDVFASTDAMKSYAKGAKRGSLTALPNLHGEGLWQVRNGSRSTTNLRVAGVTVSLSIK